MAACYLETSSLARGLPGSKHAYTSVSATWLDGERGMGGAWGFFTPTPAAQSPLRLMHPGPPAATMLGGGTRMAAPVKTPSPPETQGSCCVGKTHKAGAPVG